MLRPTIEPLYTAALIACIERIQAAIPPHDLSIQFDMAAEFAFLEGKDTAGDKWFQPLLPGLIERAATVAAAVREPVEQGFHLCYGDFGHRHFVEPRDTSMLVDVASGLLGKVERLVQWIHMPVPRSRADREYFEPLRAINLGQTELYLGLLHTDGVEETQKRIAAACEFVPSFGVGTECGLGRSSEQEFWDFLKVAKIVAHYGGFA